MSRLHEDDDELFRWLSQDENTIISSSIQTHQFPKMGKGLLAKNDILSNELLFSIPRSFLFTTINCELSKLIPISDWSILTGWSPLILCLMFEFLKKEKSYWFYYFNSLPKISTFNSLMFWDQTELNQLESSKVLNKIGKIQSNLIYEIEISKIILKFNEIFIGGIEIYSLNLFHYMGSIILSRSFHVDNESQGGDSDESDDDEEEEEEEEELENIADIALVPLADLLNAISTSSNAKLYYSPLALEMRSTSFIPIGTQIFNTYADPPNSDLLRRYGHVEENNLHDIVEIDLNMLVQLTGTALNEDEKVERAEWLIENGIEDTFSLTTEHTLPEEFISALRILSGTPAEFTKAQTKGTPPRGKLDATTVEWARKVLQARIAEYSTTVEADEILLQSTTLAPRHRMAIIVRHGEKRILVNTLAELLVEWPVPNTVGGSVKRSRNEDRSTGGAGGGGGGGAKKVRT